ncbi:hypothetical protein [Dysgonomonas macrotermitis]|uniref:Lipoprotein n=1 Tax=Dysgonomonas macrotermitis TaxID=1346286 RepID=A0A1M4SAS7_9BACT|nr:hypothetical protein [Dysgonomonas macrotermitis]SHE29292.1 hypothetical protein SAMN05444362_1014 [Dysgonomonas macrotermitis]
MKRTIKISLTVAFLLILFIGCSTKYIPVESVKTEYRDKFIRDSIFQKQLVKIYQKGDTIYRDSIVYEYRNKFVKDTVNLSDTIRIPYPIPGDPIEVNKLKWYQEACIWFTSLVLVALALYLGIKYRGKILAFFGKLVFRG